jgi:dihydrolipoamide dehydrogenase
MAETFDLIVIGAGPGGYVAAIRAAQLGMKAAVVEREHLGGICLNWGCIPTKALLRSAEIAHYIQHADAYGIAIEGKVTLSVDAIVKRSRTVAGQLSAGVKGLLKKNKVTVLDGTAKLLGSGKLSVSGKDGSSAVYAAAHIIIATGARARVLPGLEPDGKLVWTYREAMVPAALPRSLLVVGSGAIGVEFACFYRAMGTNVTLVEVADRILPVEDEEISGLAAKAFTKQGIVIKTSAKVARLERGMDSVTAHIEAGGKSEALTFDRVISAVGIVANTEGLGLEATKVQLDRGHIVTDGYGRTGEPGLYAIGDVTGAPWLAHKASHEGIICVEAIAGLPHVHAMNKQDIPGCTYSFPQVASVGLTEAKAKAAGHTVKVGRFPFIGNGKAIALGEPEGLVKTIYDAKTGALLGAHMIGAEVTELIQGYVIGKTAELTEADFMRTVFPHPTLSEMMHESTLAAYGRAVHY